MSSSTSTTSSNGSAATDLSSTTPGGTTTGSSTTTGTTKSNKPGAAAITSIFSQVAQVTDGLYLCAARGVSVRALNERGITCVINATVELPNLQVTGVEYVKVAVQDSPYDDLGAHFDAVADKILAVRAAGGATLVHCVAGVSRSASLVMAYLVKHEKLTLRDAYHHVREKRAIVRPNCSFFRQLIAFELRLHGRQTVELVSTAVGLIPDVYQADYRNILLFSSRRNKREDRELVENKQKLLDAADEEFRRGDTCRKIVESV